MCPDTVLQKQKQNRSNKTAEKERAWPMHELSFSHIWWCCRLRHSTCGQDKDSRINAPPNTYNYTCTEFFKLGRGP